MSRAIVLIDTASGHGSELIGPDYAVFLAELAAAERDAENAGQTIDRLHASQLAAERAAQALPQGCLSELASIVSDVQRTSDTLTARRLARIAATSRTRSKRPATAPRGTTRTSSASRA